MKLIEISFELNLPDYIFSVFPYFYVEYSSVLFYNKDYRK